jgi:hypothetical protein
MNGHGNKTRITRERIVRVIAIFFLFYTGADLMAPQVCSEDLGGTSSEALVAVSVDQSDNDLQLASVTKRDSDSQDKDTRQPVSPDEDCFCCCAHVLPGVHFVPGENKEKPALHPVYRSNRLPSSPPHKAYHPPRLA